MLGLKLNHTDKRSHTLQWHHNGPNSVSNHQPHDCFLNRLFRHRSKKTQKLRVTGLCAGNSSEAGEFPAQMASNTENVSIWWRHHGLTGRWHGCPPKPGNSNLMLSIIKITHLPPDKMVTISQATLLNAFSWMKMLDVQLKFHWSLFLRVPLIMFHHWFR